MVWFLIFRYSCCTFSNCVFGFKAFAQAEEVFTIDCHINAMKWIWLNQTKKSAREHKLCKIMLYCITVAKHFMLANVF